MNLKEELNEKQYEAVVDSSKYLRIIAGAGSGKTRVLTYRISYLIENNICLPYEILAITFTNKVAKEMKERAIKLLDNKVENRDLNIYTFHGFCSRFLRSEISVLGISNNFIIIDDEDQKNILKTIAVELGYKKSDDIVKDSLNYIGYQKMKGNLHSDVILSNNPKEKDLLKFFEEYEKKKNSMISLDFDDLLIYTIKILKNYEDIRAKYIRRYKHILIDEFQDTNNVQYEIVKLLTGINTSLYVVGDPDQTIYTWRGADQKIILDIEDDYYPMKTIILNENYRSTSKILEPANKLIANNKERVKKDLFTSRKDGKDVNIKTFGTTDAEGVFVASKILELKTMYKDFKYSDVAILYRSSYLSLPIENALVRRAIPYKVYGGLKFYSRKEVKDALAYFKIMINQKDDVSFERIINVPRRKIGDVSIANLKNEAHLANLSMIEYIKEIHLHNTVLKSNVITSLSDLLKKIDETKDKLIANYEAYSEVLWSFLEDIGYISYLEEDEEDGGDRVDNVTALIDDIRSYLKENPESSFIDYLNNVSLLSGQDDIDSTNTISLMTVHTAKGLEFKYVFLIGLAQGVFPNQRAMEERIDGLEEERRLCYVAFTRAKDELFVSYNTSYNYSTGMPNRASQFIGEAGIKGKDIGNSYVGNDRLYKFNFNSAFESKVNKQENKINKSVNTINISNNNNITWFVGDIAIHKAFGEGKVIDVKDGIITVDFKDFGKKKLLGNHPTLSKKEGGNNA